MCKSGRNWSSRLQDSTFVQDFMNFTNELLKINEISNAKVNFLLSFRYKRLTIIWEHNITSYFHQNSDGVYV